MKHIEEFDIVVRRICDWELACHDGMDENNVISRWMRRPLKFVGTLAAKRVPSWAEW